jgi:hypothetical protein
VGVRVEKSLHDDDEDDEVDATLADELLLSLSFTRCRRIVDPTGESRGRLRTAAEGWVATGVFELDGTLDDIGVEPSSSLLSVSRFCTPVAADERL